MKLILIFIIIIVEEYWNIILEVKIDKISLGVGLFFILVSAILLLFDSQINSITAQPTENKKNENNNGVAVDLTTIKTKINLNNIYILKTTWSLKIVGYLNGEGQTDRQTKYVDLKENKNKINLNDKSLIVDSKFNKSNDISLSRCSVSKKKWFM